MIPAGILNQAKRPLPIAFILFISGIVLARYVSPPFTILAGLILASFVLFLLLKEKRNILFYAVCSLLVFILGAANYTNFNTPYSNDISKLPREKEYYIKGAVASSVDYYWTCFGKRRASFFLKVSAYKKGNNWLPLRGLSKTEIYDNDKEYSYGDTLVISGRLKTPPGEREPGGFNYAEYLKTKRVYTIVRVKSDEDIEMTGDLNRFSIKRFILDTRRKAELLIKENLTLPGSAILNAMLIGQRSALPEETREIFVNTGTAHILSVSGLHVAVISAILFFIFRIMHIPRRASYIFVIIFLAMYVVLAGGRAPIIRAAIMITVYLFAQILERDFDVYSALSLAGIIILLINPMQIFAAGFVLSFTCVFFIAFLTPLIEKPFMKFSKNKISYYIIRTFSASLAVYIGVAPLIAYYFRIISPVTIFANIVIVPMLGIILFSGIAFILMTAVWTGAGYLIGGFIHILFMVLLKVTEALSHIPCAYVNIGRIPLYIVLIYYLTLFIIVFKKVLNFA